MVEAFGIKGGRKGKYKGGNFWNKRWKKMGLKVEESGIPFLPPFKIWSIFIINKIYVNHF